MDEAKISAISSQSIICKIVLQLTFELGYLQLESGSLNSVVFV